MRRTTGSFALLSATTLLGACGGGAGDPLSGGASSGNRAPTISGSPPASVAAGAAYAFQPQASDPDGDALSFSIQGKPAWIEFDTTTGTLSGRPTSAHVGTHSGISITANDGRSSATLPGFSITVTSEGIPEISGSPPTRATSGQAYSFTPQAIDSDGDDLWFSVRNLPPWARFDNVLGRIIGIPGPGHIGTFSGIRISVTDDTHTVSLPDFSITVEPISKGQVIVSWAAPTQNTDDSALTDLAGYLIFYGQSDMDLVQNRTVNGLGATSLVIDNLAEGTWFFQMSAFNGDNIESPRSPLVSHTIF